MQQSIHTTYNFYLKGDQAMPLIKDKRDELLEETKGTHPLAYAKKFELVSIPDRVRRVDFIELFLDSPQSKDDVVYIAVLDLSSTTVAEEVTKPTGRCTTNNIIHKGARKWETLYVLYYVIDTAFEGESPDTEYEEHSHYDTKGEAMENAKRIAIDEGAKIEVRLERRLVGSGELVAVLEPEIKTFNEMKEVPNNTFLIFGKGHHTFTGEETNDAREEDDNNSN